MLSNLNNLKGIILTSIGVVATIWLYFSNQLNLYIHPRYFTFTIVMATLGLLLIILSLKAYKAKNSSKKIYNSLLIILLSLTVLILFPPVTLSGDIAEKRGVNSGSNLDDDAKLDKLDVYSPFSNNQASNLTVKDWSNLLSKTNNPAFFVGKNVNVSGFIVSHSNNNSFYVSRFIVSCCTVDARPIGVPVYLNGWQEKYNTDQWVEIRGQFEEIEGMIAITPSEVVLIDEPKDPYVY